MSRRVVLAMPGNAGFAGRLAEALQVETLPMETRRFPDGETYLRLDGDPSGAEVLVVCTLADPDPQFLRLIYAARTARELGATRLTLVAPYLAYMRQDKRFQPGEAVTSNHFATLLSREFDRLLTADPHLHRRKAMSEIYTVPADVLHAAPALATWIAAEVRAPLIIGPDVESEQWVSEVAATAGAPAIVLRKERHGDREVAITLPDLSAWTDHTPVLVDDIVSSGRTMLQAAEGLVRAGLPPPVCLAVHPLFAEDAFARLSAVAARVVSTDSVPHESNAIGLAGLFAEALRA